MKFGNPRKGAKLVVVYQDFTCSDYLSLDLLLLVFGK